MSLTVIFHVACKLLMEAEGLWKHDPKLQKVMDKFQLHQGTYNHYTFHDLLFQRKGKMVHVHSFTTVQTTGLCPSYVRTQHVL